MWDLVMEHSFLLWQVYNAEAQAIHEQELKSYERRYKKAEKSGLVPRRLAGGEKAKHKTTKTTAKKGTTMKKTTAVNKTIAALLKNGTLLLLI